MEISFPMTLFRLKAMILARIETTYKTNRSIFGKNAGLLTLSIKAKQIVYALVSLAFK